MQRAKTNSLSLFFRTASLALPSHPPLLTHSTFSPRSPLPYVLSHLVRVLANAFF